MEALSQFEKNVVKLAHESYALKILVNSHTLPRSWHEFESKVSFQYKKEGYLVKVVTDQLDVLRLLDLRKRASITIELSDHDLASDHLIVVDPWGGRAVASVRLSMSDRTKQNLSAPNWSNTNFKEQLIADQFCIDPDYHNGTCSAVLMHGIAHYLNTCDAKYFLGIVGLEKLASHTWNKLSENLEKTKVLEFRLAIERNATSKCAGNVCFAAARFDR